MLPRAIVDVSLPAPAVVPAPRDDPGQFYLPMAYACALVAIVGFIPTYWSPVASGTFGGPPLLHLHGLLFSAWHGITTWLLTLGG